MIKQKPKILIVGAGITGTALAGLLEKRGIVPTVVEKAQDWSQRGYGITIMPAGMTVVKELGLSDKLHACGSESSYCQLCNADGVKIKRFKLAKAGIACLTLPRGDLHAALRSKLVRTSIH